MISSTGSVDHGVFLPNSPAIAGIVLHQQMVALEVDALQNLVITVSNGLQHTIGFL